MLMQNNVVNNMQTRFLVFVNANLSYTNKFFYSLVAQTKKLQIKDANFIDNLFSTKFIKIFTKN